MPLAVNDILQITYKSVYASQRVLLNLTYRVKSTQSPESVPVDLQTTANWFAAAGPASILQLYANCIGQNCVIQTVRAQRIFPVRTLFIEATAAIYGLSGSDANTGNIQNPVTLVTQLAGRKQVATKKIGPTRVDSFGSGAPTPLQMTRLGLLGAAMAAETTVPGLVIVLTPVIFHKQSNTWDDMYTYKVSDRVGTLRRRTLRIGE